MKVRVLFFVAELGYYFDQVALIKLL